MAILAAFGGVFMNMYVIMSCFFYNITELHPTTGEAMPSSKRGYGMMARQISYGEEPSYMQCVYYPKEEIDELFDPWMNSAKTFAFAAAILAFVSMLVLILACCCRFNKPTFERWLLWFYIWAAIFMLLTFLMYGGHFCKDNVCKVAEGSGYAISCFMFYLVTANTVKSMGQPPPDNMADDDDDDKGDHLWYNDDDERYGRRGGNVPRSRRSRRGDDDDDDENGSFFVDREKQDDDDEYDDGDERSGRKNRNKRNDDDDDDDSNDSDDDDDEGEDAFEDFDDEFDEDDDNNNRNNAKSRSSVSGSRGGGSRGGGSRGGGSRGGGSRGGGGSRMGNSRQSNGMPSTARSSARSARISEEMSEGGWEDASDSYDTNSATGESAELYGSNNMSGQQALSGNNAPFDGQTRRQNQFGEPVDEYGVTRPKQEKDAALHSGTYKPPASRKVQYQLPPPQYRQQEQQQPARSGTGADGGNVQMAALGSAGQQDEQAAFDNDSFFGGSRASNMTGRQSRGAQQQQDPPATRSGQWS
jgi:uncharacterized membrane protein YgcG